jgi:sulfite dehydrogenase (cytochrome) subunit B
MPRCLITLVLLGATPALADEQPVALKEAAGREVVENNCGACHSLDYIVMNSPFLDATKWQGEIDKMVKVFGAPIDEADAKIIKSTWPRTTAINRPSLRSVLSLAPLRSDAAGQKPSCTPMAAASAEAGKVIDIAQVVSKPP